MTQLCRACDTIAAVMDPVRTYTTPKTQPVIMYAMAWRPVRESPRCGRAKARALSAIAMVEATSAERPLRISASWMGRRMAPR